LHATRHIFSLSTLRLRLRAAGRALARSLVPAPTASNCQLAFCPPIVAFVVLFSSEKILFCPGRPPRFVDVDVDL